jgi:D-hexose-6-phosphate mutarotase
MVILISGTNTEKAIADLAIKVSLEFHPKCSLKRTNMMVDGLVDELTKLLQNYFDTGDISDAEVLSDKEYRKMVTGD